MENEIEKYKIGSSIVYGGLICKPSKLSNISKEDFFEILNKTLKKYNFDIKHIKIANSKTNLKKGITIGDTYFIIEK